MYRTTARRIFLRRIEEPTVRLLVKLGVSPNALTLFGLVLAGVTAYLISTGHFLAGGMVLLLSGLFDLFDGALARATGKVTAFGGVLDSVADRVGEAAVLLGLLIFYLTYDPIPEGILVFVTPPNVEMILVFLALAGSFMVSYLRARAEGAGIECGVGIMTRPERILLLALGLLINQMAIILLIIVALTFITSGQRMAYIFKALRSQ